MLAALIRKQNIIIELIKNNIKTYWIDENLYVERNNIKVRYSKYNYDFMEINKLILDILQVTEPSINNLYMKHKNKKKKGKCNNILVYSSSINSKKKFININVSEKKRDIRENLINKGIIYNL